MRAVRVTRGHVGAQLVDVPTPVPAETEILLEVTACGLCATDVDATFHPDAGLVGSEIVTLGHEAAGRVLSVGRKVAGWTPGDRAAVSCIVSCGSCRMCVRGMTELCMQGQIIGLHRDGALAEYVVAPATNLVRVPDSLPDDQAAVLTDAVATPFHALVARGGLRGGESVAIFGVGGLGQHAVLLARALGAGTVIAVDAGTAQLEHARVLGADHVLLADADVHRRVREITGGLGVDLAGVFVGAAAAVEAAFRSTARGGRVVVVGLTADPVLLPPTAALARREISLVGSGGYSTADLQDLTALVGAGRLDLSRSVSHRFPLSEALDALTMLRDRTESPRRVVVMPTS